MNASTSEELRREIVFFDVETTKPWPWKNGERCSLLEFGAILVCPQKLIELRRRSYSTLIKPAELSSITINFDRPNGINKDSIGSAPSFNEVADDVYDILHGRFWAGHNIVKFDCVRINEAFAEIGRPAPEPKGTFDTLTFLTERFGKRAGKMKLAKLANYFRLGAQRHRSLDDARMNLEVVKYCSAVLFLESSLPNIFTTKQPDARMSEIDEDSLQDNLHTKAMESEYKVLKQLRPFQKQNWKILVRIERLWEVFPKSNSRSLGIILIDKEGHLIHASVPSYHYDKFKDQLKEEQVITLSNFLVETKDKNYCPLNRPFKIKFKPDSIVHPEDTTQNFPNQTFTFADFKNLEYKDEKPTQLLDVAGLLIQVEKTSKKLKTRAGEHLKQDIFLRNERGDDIKIEFWGRNLELLRPLFTATEKETVVVVTSLIVKKFNEEIYLQATYGTKIYINFDIAQASAQMNSSRKPSSKRRSIEEDKKVEQIITLAKEEKQPFRALCVATISKVYHEEGFYYDACTTCKAEVNKKIESYWCFNCKKSLEEPSARMRIKFQIQDETGEKDVGAFEDIAKNLVRKSLDDLMTLSVEFAGDMAVKDVLEEILGKKLKFEIKVVDFNLGRPNFPFKVSKFFDWAEANSKRIKREENE